MLSANAAHAAPGDTGTGTGDASVTVIEPLQLVNSQSLEFGSNAAGPASGTVTVNPVNGACTTTGAVVHFGGCNPAEFVGMGSRNALVALRIQNVTQLTGPGAPMNLTNLQIDGNPDLSFVLQIFGLRIYRINPTTGIFDFTVGGTLNVNANQMPGAYQGSFDVRIDYF